jgi:hypothetical protein
MEKRFQFGIKYFTIGNQSPGRDERFVVENCWKKNGMNDFNLISNLNE